MIFIAAVEFRKENQVKKTKHRIFPTKITYFGIKRKGSHTIKVNS